MDKACRKFSEDILFSGVGDKAVYLIFWESIDEHNLKWTFRRSKGETATPVGGTDEGAAQYFYQPKQNPCRRHWKGISLRHIVLQSIRGQRFPREIHAWCGRNRVSRAEKKEFENISLSRRITSRRIKGREHDLLEQLMYMCEKLGRYSLALDDSTDVTNNTQLLFYLWH